MTKTKIPRRSTDTQEIQREINKLIYHPTPAQTDRELLTITVLTSKEPLFHFLEGYTELKAKGTWHAYKDENNTQIQIEFKDTPSETVGNRLIQLFNEYNKLAVKEELLYVRTEPIEESSL